jgi:hypothetical protein
VKHLLVLVLTLFMIGCGLRDPYTTKKAHFIVYNYFQFDEVEVNVDGSSSTGVFKKPVYPNIPAEFDVEIKVAKVDNYDYFPTSPTSSNGQSTNLSVNFRIMRTGTMTRALTCRAGSNITTRVYIKPLGTSQVETGCDNP